MKSLKLIIALLSLAGIIRAQDISVRDLSIEHRKNPVGIDVAQPRFSWKINGTGFNIIQSAYSIRVARSDKFGSSDIIWQSGKKESGESVLVDYDGPALKSGQRYFWQVKVWDNKGKSSKWSETAYWETGLLSTSEWKAKWIEMPGDTQKYSPAPHFRKEFSIAKQVASARAYVTSHGYYELHINGNKVGDQVLTPGWTSYSRRLQYQVYDVTSMLQQGANAVGAVLGDGWYRGTLPTGWAIYGKQLGLLMQLHIIYSDGTDAFVITDESWKASKDGAIRMCDNYNGETYDATKKLTGWDKPGYAGQGWKNVNVANYSLQNLISSQGAQVKKIEEIKPVKIFRTPSGKLIVDMGQNMVGWVRLKVSGPKGTFVTLRHAEVMDKFGEFYTDNLRSAKCEIHYTLAGSGEEIYEPRFTFMGFRFVEVDGFPGELKPENITGVVVHSDMPLSGTFECSNPLINQLQHNIQWGQNGNFVDVPTDCPQRDERLGWTGDAQAFCRTAAFNRDVAAFFTKWLKDVASDQRAGGEVPDVIPDVLNPQGSETILPSAGWGDVAVIAPWTMYTVYGDKRLLKTQYPSMKAWVEYIKKKAGSKYIWIGGSKYGDWLFYHPPVNNFPEADGHTDYDFISTAYFAYSTSLVAKAAGELGYAEDEKQYTDLFNKIKKVFTDEYVTKAGRVGTNSQTSYVLSLWFNLLPDDVRPKAAAFLVNDIKSRENHLSTGFLGTINLCHTLTACGHTDVAYDLLLQESYPSWLYPVKMGATTIWERWDGQKTDSTFEDDAMNSFNHYAYGAIGDWMYRVSAGIETAGPGYKNLLIQPHPTDKLGYVKATYESSYGIVASGWERKDSRTIYTVNIPANCTAKIIFPVKPSSSVTEGGKPVKENKNFKSVKQEDKEVIIEAGSGNYTFICQE
jgi:alpha-L-rhamnosidase